MGKFGEGASQVEKECVRVQAVHERGHMSDEG